ncbi:MAG: response regulator transcription factor [Actinomycetota bacterium]|nr:response regulator transcription factor [Actinomycetota bacterium]
MKLLLAEEPSDNRQALRTTLATETTFDLIGEACTAQEALDLAAILQPEVILLAPNLPDMSGARATAEIISRFPGTQVIALRSDDCDQFEIDEMIAAGACGCLSLRLRPLALNLARRS